ncbi:MAG: addiction module protein [Lewinellaceae bacterium]|nr:addiction module protein [Lewinellaceae bacterium]
MTIESLKSESLKLDKGMRKELAYFLLDSIFEEEELDLTPEQRAELDRRITALEDGAATLLDGDTVTKELAAKYGIEL